MTASIRGEHITQKSAAFFQENMPTRVPIDTEYYQICALVMQLLMGRFFLVGISEKVPTHY